MMNSLTIGGINVYYKGNIKKGAAVFLHGGSLNALTFKSQFDAIDAFPLLAIDLPGHGLSEKATDTFNTYNLPDYAQVLSGIVRELELSDYIVVGHSLGGNVALEAAEFLPGLRGLVLANMCPFSLPPRFDQMCRPNPYLGYLSGGDLEPQDALKLAAELVHARPELAEQLAAYILQADSSARLGFTASLAMNRFRDEFQLIEGFKKPLAMVKGKYDTIVNPCYLNAISSVSLWKNSIIELESGHLPQMEVPALFNMVIHNFYRDVFKIPASLSCA